jgi:hypothetical protein
MDVLKAIYTFLGLYFISLFSVSRHRNFAMRASDRVKLLLMQLKLDPFHAAETSPFNVHREPPRPNVKITRHLGTNAGAAPVREKRFGTINDITSGT